MIQFEQKVKRLMAKGTGQGAAMAVQTVLVNEGYAKAGARKGGVRARSEVCAGGEPGADLFG